jgi:hypothetical protein
MHETATDGKLESCYRWGKGLHKMGIEILDCVFPLLTCRAQLEGGPGDADLRGEVEDRPPSPPGRFRGRRLVGKVGICHLRCRGRNPVCLVGLGADAGEVCGRNQCDRWLWGPAMWLLLESWDRPGGERRMQVRWFWCHRDQVARSDGLATEYPIL